MRLMTAQQVRDLDRQAIEDYGISGVVLMENAGRGATDSILRRLRTRFPEHTPDQLPPIVCVAGAGNNGGDAYVLARHLLNAGYHVETVLCVERSKIRGDADINLQTLEKMYAPIHHCRREEEWQPHLPLLESASVIIDGLLGTGLGRDVDGWFLDVLQQLNSMESPLKVALDIPSGLDANSGQPRPVCFHADLTVTFAAAKVGLFSPVAEPYVGNLEVIDIGIPRVLLEQTEVTTETLEEHQLRKWLPHRGFNSHKGTFGHLLVLAGSPGKAGAALLTSRAALRSGVGLCSLLTDATTASRIEGNVPEIMCEGLPDSNAKEESLSVLKEMLERKSAVVVGPGWSQTPANLKLLRFLLTETELPLVLDADGLNLLASHLEWLKVRTAPTILTPHPGEMGRLCEKSNRWVQANRLSLAMEFAEKYSVTLVLKGARTIIASPHGRSWINLTGHAGLATGGSGDVLAGLLGSFLAQGVGAEAAACLGVYLHGLAADTLRSQTGMAGLIASDLTDQIPSLLQTWESL